MIWLCLLTLAAGIGVFMLEFPQLKKANKKKEMVAFTTLLSIGVCFNLVISIWPEIPSPFNAVIVLFHPIVKMIFQLLSS